MAHFLYLWTPVEVANTEQELKGKDRGLDHIAGDQLKRVSHNDHLWIVSIYEGNLWLAGHIHVDKVLNTQDAEAYLGRGGLYPRKFHAVTQPEEAETFKITNVHEIASELRFNSLTGKDRLIIEDDGSVTAYQLQTMRELTLESADILEIVWYGDEAEEAEDITREIDEQFADLEHRLKVEAASVECATAQLEREGWQVESVEAQKIGYDLHCSKGELSLHVEVKGTSGEDPSFIITANELAQAKSDSEFILFLVTKALESSPSLHRFTGQELIASFSFDALQYRARKKI